MEMEPKPKRRRKSKELPPELSELMNTFIKCATSFIKLFDNSEPRMTQIVREFQRIAAEVKEVQERTDRQRREARDIAEAPFRNVRASWGLSLLAAPVTTVVGTVAAVSANITKILRENGSVERVESLGKEFMGIVEPLKNELEEIKTTCERLEQKSTEVQAKYSLSDMEDFQWILTRVSHLRKRSKEVLNVTVDILGIIDKLVGLVVQVFRFSSNSEVDKELTDAIIQSADKSQNVIDNLDEMKTELRELTGSTQSAD